MYWDSTSVEFPGPPPVITRIRSRTLKLLIVSITVTKNMVGRRPGIVTLKMRSSQFAPSIFAASWSSGLMDCSPARNSSMKYPASRQMPTMITAGMAQVLEATQSGVFSRPMKRSSWLTGPNSGENSMFQTCATATMEVKYGKKAAERKKARPRIFSFSSSARLSETTNVTGMWIAE